MEVSFVVSAPSAKSDLADFLSSLTSSLPPLKHEIILSAPAAEAKRLLELKTIPCLQLVDSGAETSTAALSNRGALQARGATLVFVDSQTRFSKGWLQPLLGALEADPELGVLGSRSRSLPGETELNTGFAPSLSSQLHPAPARASSRKPLQHFPLVDSPCLAIPRAIWQELGSFDEAYTQGCEAFDLCLRLLEAGKRNGVATRSIVQSTRPKVSDSRSVEQALDRRYFQRRWKAALQSLAAKEWPRHYLLGLFSQRSTFDSKLAVEALLRWSRILTNEAPSAKRAAQSICFANEIRWAKTIDNHMPSTLRRELCKKHGNWLTERISSSGLFQSQGKRSGVWIKEEAKLSLPRGLAAAQLTLSGEIHPAADRESRGELGLRIRINGSEAQTFFPLTEGPFSLRLDAPAFDPAQPSLIELQLMGAGRANAYAYLGRKLEHVALVPPVWRKRLQAYRPQKLNQRLCIHGLHLDEEQLLDFASNPSSPQCFDFIRNNSDLGINLVGWHTAELGVGESARVAAKALQASQIAHALVPLKATCLALKGDQSLAPLLQDDNPYPINIFHIDAPQSKDIDPSHGKAFRQGKYNIAFWAWELPEFPDAWIDNFQYFDEIWTPSNFVRDAISAKSPLPVVTIPHCIDFEIPEGDQRSRFGLPADKYLFCFAYDLNSYQSRKNPQAIIDAYRSAFLSSDRKNDVGLVIKTQSRERNPEEFAKLRDAIEGLPDCHLIDQTLPREAVYGLMQACDSYVSLHRSEGFGLTVAESMFLGKPVISTNWSATSEFLDAQNGCPVDYQLVELQETFGPYAKGQHWAEASVEHAANYMRRLVNDSGYAQSIGQAAARSIRARFSPTRVAKLYEARLKAMCTW
ncbi:glycosyltransferase [Pelagicoccus enzymogenes]|uniref:glycosyltransferase n=1 Tax=Pelagicoccus enzymogenes TaxID=2773457 RepID=UPI0028109863|nr:glycosyltransferase [Pelagicoccus enzymogenes]MDQ8197560.1 glycosyltransferase [Pelagicoccus enzymogenes]